jgi:hypothetical protein
MLILQDIIRVDDLFSGHCHVSKRPVSLTLFPLQTIQKPTELMDIQRKHFILTFRPAKPIFLQTLMPETKSVAIPVKNLDDIFLPVTETEHMAGQGIEFQLV